MTDRKRVANRILASIPAAEYRRLQAQLESCARYQIVKTVYDRAQGQPGVRVRGPDEGDA